MKITLVQWLELEALRKKAMEAADELGHKLTMLGLNMAKEKNYKDGYWLIALSSQADDAIHSLSRIDTNPQSEWMGGPTSGPGSEKTKTYIREPNVCFQIGERRYFTAQEVQDAKDAGLLKGGPDLTGPETLHD